MNFDKSDLQTMLLDSAERLLGERAGIEYWREQKASEQGFERDRWLQFAELGWLALPLPESAGGLAGTIEDVALLNIALGAALATEPYISTAILSGHILANGTNEALGAEILSAAAEGRMLVALGHQEEGLDPLSVEPKGTVARRTENGFILSGTKFMALDAPSADKLIVSATIEGEEGTALFLLDKEATGLSVQSYPMIDGTRAADLRLANVSLPSEALIAGGNAGASLLQEAIDRASIALLAQAVGSMESCLKICGDYTKERVQFGTPIASFQAIQHILADMFVAAHQARSMLYHAIAASSADAEKRAAAISAAKLVIGEAAQLVSRNGIQVHGGYGLTDEYPISHHYRRLMAIEKLYGDIERHERRFGGEAVGA